MCDETHASFLDFLVPSCVTLREMCIAVGDFSDSRVAFRQWVVRFRFRQPCSFRSPALLVVVAKRATGTEPIPVGKWK